MRKLLYFQYLLLGLLSINWLANLARLFPLLDQFLRLIFIRFYLCWFGIHLIIEASDYLGTKIKNLPELRVLFIGSFLVIWLVYDLIGYSK
jgi:hypothetical protein